MDKIESVRHFKKILKLAEERGISFIDCWNEWAQELMEARQWDHEANEYKKKSDLLWEQRATVTYEGEVFKGRSIEENKKITLSGSGLDFANCIFPGRASFKGATFPKNADFSDARFLDGVNFDDCLFEGNAEFSVAKIYRFGSFKKATFEKDAYFAWLESTGRLGFENARFKDFTRFSEAIFKGKVSFLMTRFLGVVDFTETQFHSSSDFKSVRSDVGFYLIDTYFKMIPDFRGYKFDHLPYVHNLSITFEEIDQAVKEANSDTKSTLRKGVSKFQALKAIGIQAYDHEKEVEFFAREMQCLSLALKEEARTQACSTKMKAFMTRMPFIAYNNLSDYGQSIFNPFCIWIVSILVFANLYAFMCAKKVGAALFLSYLNSLPVLGLWKSEARQRAIDEIFGSTNPPEFYWEAIFSIQNIWASVLIYLLLLAVRNRFKIK